MPASSSDSARPALSAEEQTLLVSTLQIELAETTAKNQSLQDTIANLAHENALLKRKLYGNKTERSHTVEAQLTLRDLLSEQKELQKKLAAAVEKAKEESEPQDPAPRGRAKPKGRRDLLASNLPLCVVEVRDERLEEQGARLITFEDSTQLMFKRGGYAVLVKRIAKYEVKKDAAVTVIAAQSPEVLLPRAMLHTSVVAQVITSKMGQGTPLYRLEQDMRDQGVALDRGTMSRYVEDVGNTYGATIVHAMWALRAIVCPGDLDGRHRRHDPAREEQGWPAAGMQEGALFHRGRRLRRRALRLCRAAHQRFRAEAIRWLRWISGRPMPATSTTSSNAVAPRTAKTA